MNIRCYFSKRKREKKLKFENIVSRSFIYFSARLFRVPRNLDRFLAATKVFRINMVTVIGPTPPGTGVMKPATLLTPEIRKNLIEEIVLCVLLPNTSIGISTMTSFVFYTNENVQTFKVNITDKF